MIRATLAVLALFCALSVAYLVASRPPAHDVVIGISAAPQAPR